MFHVSTLLPYIENDRQQIPRKRHIGNDMVTVVFQEAGALPFSPKRIRSNFQHIFLVVRAVKGSVGKMQYRVAVSCEQTVPNFGPPLPPNPLFESGREFREFLLAKIVNAENAGFRTKKFSILRSKTLSGSITDMINRWRSKTLLSSSSGKFGLLFKAKPRKPRSKSMSHEAKLGDSLTTDLLKMNCTMFWNIELIEDMDNCLERCCFLGIGPFNVVVVNARTKTVVFSVPSRTVIGWTIFSNEENFLLYFDQGEFVNVHFETRHDLNNAVAFLQKMTKGCHVSLRL